MPLDCGQWTVPVYALQIQNGLFHWKDEHEGLSYDIFYCLEKVAFICQMCIRDRYGYVDGEAVNFGTLFTFYSLSVAFYMPTLALTNSVAYTALDLSLIHICICQDGNSQNMMPPLARRGERQRKNSSLLLMCSITSCIRMSW